MKKNSDVKKELAAGTLIRWKTIPDSFVIDNKPNFLTYQKSFINSASQTAQATRPNVVGQMSDLVPLFIRYCEENKIEITTETWKVFYNMSMPRGFTEALKKIEDIIKKQIENINKITNSLIKRWLEYFLYTENLHGLLIQYRIMNELKKAFPRRDIRAAHPSEESKNIDIVIDGKAYQVKPLDSQRPASAESAKWGGVEGIWYEINAKNNTIEIIIPRRDFV